MYRFLQIILTDIVVSQDVSLDLDWPQTEEAAGAAFRALYHVILYDVIV